MGTATQLCRDASRGPPGLTTRQPETKSDGPMVDTCTPVGASRGIAETPTDPLSPGVWR
jgi:hypothetical protein